MKHDTGYNASKESAVRDLAWDSILSVGVDEIDEDHKKLITTFNILNHALSEGESREYLTAVLTELINCTVWHFSHEERLMLKYDYVEREQHKAIHQQLIKSARDLENRILQGDKTVSDEDLAYLESWLTEHILTDDLRMGNYLSQVM